MREISPKSLSEENFLPYGKVIEHRGIERRLYIPHAYSTEHLAMAPSLWISRIRQSATLPFVIEEMECHPYSNQTFIPMQQSRMLVITALCAENGEADLDTLAAFITSPGQGVTYNRNTWHFGLTSLKAPADFVVAMSLTGNGDDTIFAPIEHPVSIHDNSALEA